MPNEISDEKFERVLKRLAEFHKQQKIPITMKQLKKIKGEAEGEEKLIQLNQ